MLSKLLWIKATDSFPFPTTCPALFTPISALSGLSFPGAVLQWLWPAAQSCPQLGKQQECREQPSPARDEQLWESQITSALLPTTDSKGFQVSVVILRVPDPF